MTVEVVIMMRAERINSTISLTNVSVQEILFKAETPQKKWSSLFSPQKRTLRVKPVCTAELMHPQI
jgi:hypothetical protein